MRTVTLLLAIAAGIAAFGEEASACSIRGGYCGYPSWAANAFEGRFGYKGNPRNLTYYYPGNDDSRPHVRRDRHRRR